MSKEKVTSLTDGQHREFGYQERQLTNQKIDRQF